MWKRRQNTGPGKKKSHGGHSVVASSLISKQMVPRQRGTPFISQLVHCKFVCSWMVNHEALEETDQVSKV